MRWEPGERVPRSPRRARARDCREARQRSLGGTGRCRRFALRSRPLGAAMVFARARRSKRGRPRHRVARRTSRSRQTSFRTPRLRSLARPNWAIGSKSTTMVAASIGTRSVEAANPGYPSETRAELLEALLTPGFSTRADVTELSGRGVGLAVVANVVRELSGRLTLRATRAKARAGCSNFRTCESMRLLA